MEVRKCEKCSKEAKGTAECAAMFATYKLNGDYVLCKRCKDCNPEANVTCFTCHDEAKTMEEAEVKFADSFKQAVAKQGKFFKKDKALRMECVTCVKQREKEQHEEEQRQRETKLEAERRKREAEEKRLKEQGLVPYEDMDYKVIFTDAVVDKLILDHISSDPFPSVSSNASSLEEFNSLAFGHLSDGIIEAASGSSAAAAAAADLAETGANQGKNVLADTNVVVDLPSAATAVLNRDLVKVAENSDNSPVSASEGVMVFWAHVAEDLLNLAHDKPHHRNVFMHKTVTNEHGDALELYTLNRKGVLEPRTVVENFLANQPFNKAIFSAIKAGIVRYWKQRKEKISAAGEGSDALKAALAACDHQMGQWLKNASDEVCRNTHWMKNVLLRYGRLHSDEERVKKSSQRRKSAGIIGSTPAKKASAENRGYESDPLDDADSDDDDRHEKRRRRRASQKDVGESTKRERSPSAKKNGGSSAGKPPRKKAEVAESETPVRRKSQRHNAGSDPRNFVDVDEEEQDDDEDLEELDVVVNMKAHVSDNDYNDDDDKEAKSKKGKRDRSRSLSPVLKKERGSTSGKRKLKGSDKKKRAASPSSANKKLNYTEEKIAAFVEKLTDYVEDHPDEPFRTIVEEKPDLIAENGPLAARSFREVGLFYFDVDTGLGVGLTRELADKYRKQKSFDRNAPLALSVFKKKKGLAVIVDIVKEGKLFGLVEEAVKHEGLTPYFA